ncbi:hypothetical protein J6590_066830 [Homalodisca vitripennis]|nr:hypothetical protein J6590_066830 [Homalodisca vitripennis]
MMTNGQIQPGPVLSRDTVGSCISAVISSVNATNTVRYTQISNQLPRQMTNGQIQSAPVSQQLSHLSTPQIQYGTHRLVTSYHRHDDERPDTVGSCISPVISYVNATNTVRYTQISNQLPRQMTNGQIQSAPVSQQLSHLSTPQIQYGTHRLVTSYHRHDDERPDTVGSCISPVISYVNATNTVRYTQISNQLP